MAPRGESATVNSISLARMVIVPVCINNRRRLWMYEGKTKDEDGKKGRYE